MALFQPTNVIPSSFTDGVVDANDVAQISWQVNGNSAMTAYQIDFIDINSNERIYSTNKITEGIPVGGFYGVDRFGQPKMFTWTAAENKSWNALNSGFANGGKIKFKITQWYAGQDKVSMVNGTTRLYAGHLYYFVEGEEAVVFSPLYDGGAKDFNVYFSYTTSNIWAEASKDFLICEGYRTAKRSVPSGATLIDYGVLNYTNDALFLTETGTNIFNFMSTPQVTIYLSDSEYQAQNDLIDGGSISSSIGYFKAVYTQEQGDPVRNVRWQVATVNVSRQIGEIIADTGEVNTPTLQFEFKGFFAEQLYAVRCLVESESGQNAINSASQNDGWIFFSVGIESQKEYDGQFDLQCLPRENAALLRWTANYVTSQSVGDFALQDGYVTLDPNASIKWEGDKGFSSPWTAAISFDFMESETFSWNFTLSNQQTVSKRFNSTGGRIRSVRVRCYDRISGMEFEPPVVTVTTTITPSDRMSCTVNVTSNKGGSNLIRATIELYEERFGPTGELAKIDMGEESISVIGSMRSSGYSLSVNGQEVDLPDQKDNTTISVSLVLNASKVLLYSNNGMRVTPVKYTQNPIKSIQIYGGTKGATFRCVAVYQGDLSEESLSALNYSYAFKPSWESADYQLYMAANFNGNIYGGKDLKFRIYRQEVGSSELRPIYFAANGDILQLKDFGIVSRKAYTYWLYEYGMNNEYVAGVQCTYPDTNLAATISTNFRSYSLLVCDYDGVNDAYHVRKQYLFSLNLSEGNVGNNNAPTLNANFTAYPTRMPSTQNYASGTLQGLIGAIYTVPALVEQIGGLKHTAKPSTLDYFDSVDLEKELYDLSVAPYQLFLRDMKGHLRMVATNSAISMTQNLKQRQQSITISFPWVEIGDASDVTIIQTPDDYGWNNDEQVLDVRLDADATTGILSAYYPKPYNGTKFYLTGTNKEILGAETPLGVTPAQFELSEKADAPEDGILSATAKVNTERGG